MPSPAGGGDAAPDAALICDGEAHPVDDPARIEAVQDSTRPLDPLISAELDADVSEILDAGRLPSVRGAAGARTRLGRSIRGSTPGPSASPPRWWPMRRSAAAGAETVVDRRLGMATSPPRTYLRPPALSHLSFRSVWFRNALRGAVGLALAVAVVEVTNVSHGFWVVLGTMSVLRSERARDRCHRPARRRRHGLGFVVGSAIMIGVADHTVLLWVLLPVAVLISGMAPSMISFAAGQAAFTVVVIILFNIIEPTGWKVGLTRIEDVAIGCGVSVVVGILFWPRGATAALGRALSAAFVANSGYLADAVERLTMTTRPVDTEPGQRGVAPRLSAPR